MNGNEGTSSAAIRKANVLPSINIKLLSALCIIGFIMHSYRFTQMLNNHDDIGSLYRSYGVGTTSGRWALSLLGDFVNDHLILGSFDLPLFNGMLSLFLLAISACIILEMFGLQENVGGYIFGVLFVCFPTYAGTLLYMYTAVYYGISCFLAVWAVYLWKQSKLLAWILGVLCSSISTGIYQAYFPVTVCLILMVYIVYVINSISAPMDLIKKALYYIASILLSLMGYYLILQIILRIKGLELTSYQGISDMGMHNISDLSAAIQKCYTCFIKLATTDYHHINTLPITKWCLGILIVLIVCETVYHIIYRKDIFHKVILGASIFLFPLGVNFIEIMCSKSFIYELMIYSTALVYLFPLILHSQAQKEHLVKTLTGKMLNILLVIVTISYIWHDNWNYVALNFVNKQTESYVTIVVTSIKLTEGYKDEYPVLFYGGGKIIKDLQYKNPYTNYSKYFFTGADNTVLLNTYTWKEALAAYTGFAYTPAENDIYDKYADAIDAMPCYPDYGSIKIINETIVVKFSENEK